MRPKAKARTLDNSARSQATGAGMSAKETQATVSITGMLVLIWMVAIARTPARADTSKSSDTNNSRDAENRRTKWQRISFKNATNHVKIILIHVKINDDDRLSAVSSMQRFFKPVRFVQKK
jgi:hypothetical protein